MAEPNFHSDDMATLYPLAENFLLVDTDFVTFNSLCIPNAGFPAFTTAWLFIWSQGANMADAIESKERLCSQLCAG